MGPIYDLLGVLLSDAWYKDLNGPPGCQLRWVRNQKSRESRASRPPLISTTVISCYQTHNDVTTYRTFFSVLILVNCIFLVNNFILWFNSSVCYYNIQLCNLHFNHEHLGLKAKWIVDCASRKLSTCMNCKNNVKFSAVLNIWSLYWTYT
jgi:hypothetical protein